MMLDEDFGRSKKVGGGPPGMSPVLLEATYAYVGRLEAKTYMSKIVPLVKVRQWVSFQDSRGGLRN